MSKHKKPAGGKGDNIRPREVDYKTYSDNWDRIFGKKYDDTADEQKKVDKSDKK